MFVNRSSFEILTHRSPTDLQVTIPPEEGFDEDDETNVSVSR